MHRLLDVYLVQESPFLWPFRGVHCTQPPLCTLLAAHACAGAGRRKQDSSGDRDVSPRGALRVEPAERLLARELPRRLCRAPSAGSVNRLSLAHRDRSGGQAGRRAVGGAPRGEGGAQRHMRAAAERTCLEWSSSCGEEALSPFWLRGIPLVTLARDCNQERRGGGTAIDDAHGRSGHLATA